MSTLDHEIKGNLFSFRHRWILIAFIVIAAILLISEHKAHVMGVLPWLLLALCPLLHIFKHKGHSHDGEKHD